jgi:hypothetical protein
VYDKNVRVEANINAKRREKENTPTYYALGKDINNMKGYSYAV